MLDVGICEDQFSLRKALDDLSQFRIFVYELVIWQAAMHIFVPILIIYLIAITLQSQPEINSVVMGHKNIVVKTFLWTRQNFDEVTWEKYQELANGRLSSADGAHAACSADLHDTLVSSAIYIKLNEFHFRRTILIFTTEKMIAAQSLPQGQQV